MPRKDTISINTNLTPEQAQIVRQLSAGDGGIAQYLRRLLADDAERQGIEWPAHIERGRYTRNPEITA